MLAQRNTTSVPSRAALHRLLDRGDFQMQAVLDSNAIQAVFAQPSTDGSFEGPVLDYLRSVGARRPILLLAFAPKSAGTYFRQAAMHAVGGELIRMCHAQGGRDGTLYLPNVLACCLDQTSPATVTHIHMQALTANRKFIEALGLKPVIMIRDLADMLASLLDNFEGDPVARAEGVNCQVPSNFCDMDRATKLDFMIDVIAPWYASNFATWKSFVDDAPRTVCVLRYRDFCVNPAESLHKAISHAGFVTTRQKCIQSLEEVWRDKESYRFNKGVSGRGRFYFLPEHFRRLHRLLSYYPQLERWVPELLGENAELAAAG
jgi:hypothetical protein